MLTQGILKVVRGVDHFRQDREDLGIHSRRNLILMDGCLALFTHFGSRQDEVKMRACRITHESDNEQ